MTTPHDSLFKWTFSVPSRAAEELRCVLPAEVSARLDWDALQPVPGEFTNKELRGLQADLLFSAPTHDGRTALLYILFEHQSTSDPLMPLRLLTYTTRIWEHWLEKNKSARTIPPVLSVVLHHSANGWSAPVELTELYDADPDFIRAAGPHLPKLQLLLDDLPAVSDDELRARATSAFVRLVLLLLKHSRDSSDINDRFLRWSQLANEVAGASTGLEALATMMRYLLHVSKHTTREQVAGMLRSVLGNKKAEHVMMTAGQQLIEQGRQEGIEQGQRKILRRQLERRFGELPVAITEQVEAASVSDLERWADQILLANSLDELFG